MKMNIKRMQQRLAERPHESSATALIYEHGTHFVFPDTMLRMMLPIGSSLFVSLMFKDGRRFSKECRQTRIDIDQKTRDAILEW